MQQSLRTLAGRLLVVPTLFAFVSCGPAPNKAPKIQGAVEAPSAKPNGNSVSRVAIASLGEISHIERALRPFLGISPSLETTADGSPTENCRVRQVSKRAMWETRWKCGMDSTVSGRKEVEGYERTNYDTPSRTLSYRAKFETRTFTSTEARNLAHTLETMRSIQITFTDGSNETSGSAKIRIRSQAAILGGVPGSAWTSVVNGTLIRTGSEWALADDMTVDFEGALFGEDDERSKMVASGEYKIVSDSNIVLRGISEPSTCTKPVGNWTVKALGAGEKFDTAMITSETGGQQYQGVTFAWPANLCERP